MHHEPTSVPKPNLDHKLPIELLQQIFAYLPIKSLSYYMTSFGLEQNGSYPDLSEDDKIPRSVSQVSRYWRSAALAYSPLWRVIDWKNWPTEQIRVWVGRAKSTEMGVVSCRLSNLQKCTCVGGCQCRKKLQELLGSSAEIQPSTSLPPRQFALDDERFELLLSVSSSWYALNIVLEWPIDDFQWGRLKAILKKRAKRLEILGIRCNYRPVGSQEEEKLHIHFPSSSFALNLREIRLRGILVHPADFLKARSKPRWPHVVEVHFMENLPGSNILPLNLINNLSHTKVKVLRIPRYYNIPPAQARPSSKKFFNHLELLTIEFSESILQYFCNNPRQVAQGGESGISQRHPLPRLQTLVLLGRLNGSFMLLRHLGTWLPRFSHISRLQIEIDASRIKLLIAILLSKDPLLINFNRHSIANPPPELPNPQQVPASSLPLPNLVDLSLTSFPPSMDGKTLSAENESALEVLAACYRSKAAQDHSAAEAEAGDRATECTSLLSGAGSNIVNAEQARTSSLYLRLIGINVSHDCLARMRAFVRKVIVHRQNGERLRI